MSTVINEKIHQLPNNEPTKQEILMQFDYSQSRRQMMIELTLNVFQMISKLLKNLDQLTTIRQTYSYWEFIQCVSIICISLLKRPQL